MTETAKAPVRCGLSGTALKYIACITMLIDHIGASCIEAGILLPALAAGAASCGGIPVSTLLAADRVLRYIGRLAFPIFCFLAVEGFLHTHDVKKYVRRLLLFGLLSEVPFDLAFFRTPFAPQHQNVYWTLALGVLAMAGLKRFEKENGLPGWQGLVWAGGCAALALAANTDYHAIGVLIICTLYLTRADRKRQCLAGALLFLFELTAPLDPAEVFRIAGPCAMSTACAHFDDSRSKCRLAIRTVRMAPVVVSKPPRCAIRSTCMWWHQEGVSACLRCPQVVTNDAVPSERVAATADPTNLAGAA